jgi:hypothetical protein
MSGGSNKVVCDAPPLEAQQILNAEVAEVSAEERRADFGRLLSHFFPCEPILPDELTNLMAALFRREALLIFPQSFEAVVSSSLGFSSN